MVLHRPVEFTELIRNYGLFDLLQGPIWGPIDIFNSVMSNSE